MNTNTRLSNIEERLSILEKIYITVLDLSGYSEIKLIEEKATNSVIEYLKEKYPGFMVLQSPIKYFYDPITDEKIIELDNIIILSNDPNDILNNNFNIDENELRKHLREMNEQLDLTPSILESIQSLKRSNEHFQSQLKTILKLSPNDKYTRIFVIVETKHKEEIEKKLNQIKNFIDQAKLYYEVYNPIEECRNQIKELNKQLKHGTVNTKQFNTKKIELLNNPKYAGNIEKILYDRIDDYKWTDKFIKTCDYENFNFDDVLYMGR